MLPLNDTAPPTTLLDALQDELAGYERARAAFLEKQGVDSEYRAAVLRMWGYAFAAQRARIERARAGEEWR